MSVRPPGGSNTHVPTRARGAYRVALMVLLLFILVARVKAKDPVTREIP